MKLHYLTLYIVLAILAVSVSALTWKEVWTSVVAFVDELDAMAGKLNRWAEKRLKERYYITLPDSFYEKREKRRAKRQ